MEDITMENNVKRNYQTPEAEKIVFNYRDQVVAASGGDKCVDRWIYQGTFSCTEGNQHLEHIG